MDILRKNFDDLNLRGRVVRSWNIIVIVVSFICLLLVAIAWGVTANFLKQGLTRRHFAAIPAFFSTFITLMISIATLYCRPFRFFFVVLQLMSLLSFFLITVSGGMVAVVVNVCMVGGAGSEQNHCVGYGLEYIAGLCLTAAMATIFLATQQRLMVLEEHGVLEGFGNRISSGQEM